MKKIIKQEQWVMLPTEDKSQIQYRDSDNKLLFYHNGVANNETVHLNPQHLYLTSDEEIKEGDTIIDIRDKQLQSNVRESNVAIYNDHESYKKIIATTDKSLRKDIPTLNTMGKPTIYPQRLPQIPESFIKYYVEKQGKVGDVEVEIFNPAGGMIGALKLTENNEIFVDIPKKEEKMYSRDEVSKLIAKYWLDEMSGGKLHGEVGFAKWIKENL